MPDMLVKLYDLPPAAARLEVLAKQGVVIRRAGSYERHQVVAWVEAHFWPGWASECAVAFARSPLACFVAVEEGRMLGFACYDVTRKGFFGPTGVCPDARGRGIGTGLLVAALEALWQEGYAYAIIGGAGPTDFYERAVGATIIPGSVPGIYRDRIKSIK